MNEASMTASRVFNSSHALGPLSGHRDSDGPAITGSPSPEAAAYSRRYGSHGVDGSLKASQSSGNEGAHGLRYPPEPQESPSQTSSNPYGSNTQPPEWFAPHTAQEPLANASIPHSQTYDESTSNGHTTVPSESVNSPSALSGFARQAGRRSVQIFGTPQIGIIGKHKPREIVRIDRDYSDGEICQFWSGYPMELEGRVSATQHLTVMNELNTILASAFNPYRSIFDNLLAVFSLYISTWLLSSHYDREILKFEAALEQANRNVYNGLGLNLLNPKKNGYLFLELEYY